ncbi:GPI2-domain-containing protein [Patellaria atrata CBS 101060]|uniref:GPI2-domain-containing protein n=1 Tax=Patellaria atrata CBS 101060 TaxID=1346257 RepID=A0A9P4SAQ2_9PEZI|nr:GPI2-domain-containing protein [Patellaria atrata CBS 101060]
MIILDPDNYTDEETFLDHLQRNPRLQPYEFWPLVAASTVIVQHICSVTIFVCCFTGIVQDRVSPITVVSWGSLGTILGWAFWDSWVGQEEAGRVAAEAALTDVGEGTPGTSSTDSSTGAIHLKETQGLGLTIPNVSMGSGKGLTASPSVASLGSAVSIASPVMTGHPTGAPSFATYSYLPPYGETSSTLSPRNQQRIATVKSAILIYCALLGLSPILKSLTKSTTSDSIWAMSCWLMCINVAFFDYSGGAAK